MQQNEYYSEIFHEIKNSVALIAGYLQLLEKKFPTIEEQVYWSTIKNEIFRLRKIVTEYSQLHFGQNLHLECIDLRNFLRDCCNHISSLSDTEQLLCNLSLPETPLWTSIDCRQFHHVIINLLKNACEATDYHGVISIVAFSENSDICIRIADSGPGISPELLPYIFEPFTTTKETGSGLGLNIAKQIVTSHNGRITVKSRTGEGCTFTIILPGLSKHKQMV